MTQDPEDDAADDLAGYSIRNFILSLVSLVLLSSNKEAKILFLFAENPG